MGRYLDHACLGPPSEATVRAVEEAVRALRTTPSPGTDRTIAALRETERARERVAALLEAHPEDVSLVDSTTHGLGVIAAGMTLHPGDNVVVPDMDFMSATLVWRPAEAERGIELRPVPSEQGVASVDAFAHTIDERTRAVVVSVVQEISGYRVDLEALGTMLEGRDTVLLVDGIQEAGALRRDLANRPVDAYIAGGHKWLSSPYGMGFAWTHPRLRDRHRSSYLGYTNVEEPAPGWGRYLQDRHRTAFDRHAARSSGGLLESGGTPDWIGAVGLRAAVDELLARGPADVERHVLALASQLRTGLARIGLGERIAGSGDPMTHSGIVTFGLPGGEIRERQLYDELTRSGIYVSLRAIAGTGGIRVSPHATNTADDIDALLEVVREYRRRDRPG
ncbi:aminotransferase class V-fold PLP-dependent enzyme [Egibacter rhizosphaerae]|uniref:aminotransferase class V-fold PLP-dependent enzyme n=1 Tax=Egibacter rhizosphaerae TaxID=1670831 RepID=UPI0013F15FD3|nr:aminotransferase class V-fold PLP-dependent enzyme [Egibacter rhizosphaerae]